MNNYSLAALEMKLQYFNNSVSLLFSKITSLTRQRRKVWIITVYKVRKLELRLKLEDLFR